MNLRDMLEFTISANASDLHLVTGFMPEIRVNGELTPISATTILTKSDIDSLINSFLTPYQKEIFEKKWELDCGINFENKVRFRVNIYRQSGFPAVSFRLIPKTIRTLEETGLPNVIGKLTELEQGLVLVTGPTGHGKSTTIASLINQINLTRSVHILTIEDPIEFVYPPGKALISQRELYTDTQSWGNALKAALREDPNVVLIGEMRDYETISSAMTIAETGHLVFATLHTNSAAQSIDRIIDVFPENQQSQVKTQLAASLEAIISQRLVPTINPGRILATEILFAVPALRAMIREGKSHLIDSLIQTSGETGMISMESALAMLVREGLITLETAQNYALKPQVLSKLLGNSS